MKNNEDLAQGELEISHQRLIILSMVKEANSGRIKRGTIVEVCDITILKELHDEDSDLMAA